VTVQWRRAEAAGARAAIEALRANAEATRAGALARAEAEARAAEKALRIRAQAEIVARDFDRGLELARRGDGDLGLLWMGEALRQAPPEEPALTRVLRANLAAWQGPSPPLRAILEHHGRVTARFRPDGGAVLTGSRDGTARLWDAATGRPLGPPLAHGDIVFQVVFSPDGRRVLTGGYDGKVRIWDPATGQPAGPTLVHGEPVWYLAYAPGGRLLLTHGRDLAVRLWDAATGRLVGPPIGAGLIGHVHFSADGRLLLTGGTDGQALLWDVATGRPSGPALRQDGTNFTGFSPDGRFIVAGSADGTLSLWETATRRLVAAPVRHDSPIHTVVFSPDGRRLLTLRGDSTARIVDAASGRPIGPPIRHGGWASAEFSPDGRLIATAGGSDRTAHLWDVATGRPIGPPLRHRLAVGQATFSPDGRLLLTSSEDGTVKLWAIDRAEAGAPVARPDEPAGATVATTPAPGTDLGSTEDHFSPDRSRVILIGRRRLARLVDVGSGQPVGPPMEQRWPWIRSATFSPDGTRLAIASHDVGYGAGGSTSTACRIWDAAAGRPVSPVLPLVNWVAALAFRPDGEVLATGDYRGAVHLWDVRTGACVGGPLYARYVVLSLAFSPDGRVLAAGTAHTGNQAIAWDLATSRMLGEPVRFRGEVTHLAFSGDGTRLAAGSDEAKLIEVATGRVIGEPLRSDGWVSGLAFSPDDRFLLTVAGGKSEIGAARLWDARSGRPTSPGLAHPTRVAENALAFNPDGSAFATGCVDGSVRIWDVATARPIGPTRMLRGPALGVAFDRDGRSLIAVDDRGNVRTWALREPVVEPVERLIGRVQGRIGIELDAAKEVAVIGPEEWQRRRETGESGPTPDPAAEAGWHEDCARDAEAIGDGFGARWHLDRLIAARPDDGLLHARRARAWLWAEDVRSADIDLTRAINLGPRDRVLDWLEHRAADSLADGRPADALRLLDRAVAARPGDWLAYSLRAEVLAKLGRTADREADLARAIERGADIPFLLRLAVERSRAGRWAEAVALYDRAIAMGTIPYEVWNEAATAHLEVGDEAGYRRVCEVMRGRHPAAIPEIFVRANLASVLTLGPGGIGDDGKGLAWIENLPAAAPPTRKDIKRGFQQVSGALLFRAGRSAEAIGRIREAIETGDGKASFDEAVLLAMLASQAGEGAQARAMLDRLGDVGPDGPSSDAWWSVQARRLLRREAIRMILDPGFPADPFAR
jgi:WD40 repeat protein